MKQFLIALLKDVFLDVLKEIYEWAKTIRKKKEREDEVKDAVKQEDRQDAAGRINNVFRNK